MHWWIRASPWNKARSVFQRSMWVVIICTPLSSRDSSTSKSRSKSIRKRSGTTFFIATTRRSRSTRHGQKFSSGFDALIPKFKRLYLTKGAEQMPARLREAFEKIVTVGLCDACGGTRLSQAARACRVEGKNIAECCSHAGERTRPVRPFASRAECRSAAGTPVGTARSSGRDRTGLSEFEPRDRDAVRWRIATGEDGAPSVVEPDGGALHFR